MQIEDISDALARAVREVRFAALDQAAVFWPDEPLEAPLAAVLARGWLPDAPIPILHLTDIGGRSLEGLRRLIGVNEISVGGRDLEAFCDELGVAVLVTAGAFPGEPLGRVRLVSPLAGWGEEALESLAAMPAPPLPKFDDHELVVVAMQRMRRLGYL
jgi:hypothetical protein